MKQKKIKENGSQFLLDRYKEEKKKGGGEEKFEYCTLTDETKKRHDPAREKCIGELGVCMCVCVGEDCEVDSKVLQQRQQQHDIDVRLIIIIVIFFFPARTRKREKGGGNEIEEDLSSSLSHRD